MKRALAAIVPARMANGLITATDLLAAIGRLGFRAKLLEVAPSS